MGSAGFVGALAVTTTIESWTIRREINAFEAQVSVIGAETPELSLDQSELADLPPPCGATLNSLSPMT
ncbi:MAG: hypothetical protein R8G34_13965 [Paracoccaceae bacterium]|nr:hypothetical protein [Paracoccaceae bacterium]